MKRFLYFLLFRFFPDNLWLRKHWWHRLALIIAGSITTFGLIISIFLIYVFVGQLKDYLTPFDPIKEGGTPLTQAEQFNKEQGITPPTQYMPSGGKDVTDQYPVGTTISAKDYVAKYGGQTRSIDWSILIWSITWILMAYLIPSGVYRVILFVLTDNKWRNKAESIN